MTVKRETASLFNSRTKGLLKDDYFQKMQNI